MLAVNTILCGNTIEEIKKIPKNSIHCIITSPPYWNLRKYDVPDVQITPDYYGQLGQESSPEQFVGHLAGIFNSMWDVLTNDGTMWIIIGDSYLNKSLCGVPWLLAQELKKTGWYIRNDVIISRTKPKPESVKDRFTRSHEYLFHLTKSPKYYYDIFNAQIKGATPGLNRNMWSVIETSSSRYGGDHTAPYAESLIEPLIKISTSDYGCCSNCGAQCTRIIKKEEILRNANYKLKYRYTQGIDAGQPEPHKVGVRYISIGWKESCSCNAKIKPCIVLDPFAGICSAASVARRLGRDWIMIELSEKYIEQANKRLGITLL